MLMNKITENLREILPLDNIKSGIDCRKEYSKDASGIKGGLPDVVVFVETTDQVQNVVKLANQTSTPIICRGAGTNTVGACITNNGGIIMDFSKMNKILEINKENMTARVQPGVIVGNLQAETEKVGLYYPPDPSYLAHSTIGGSIAQNSAGARTFKYGATKDYVLDMLVVTSRGEILRTGSNTIKNSTGYNLGSLFIGSEGTLGIVVEATLKLIPKPEATKVILAYFDAVEDASNTVSSIIEHKILPATLDFMDKNSIKTVEKFNPSNLETDKEAALIIELDGDKTEIKNRLDIIVNILKDCQASKIEISKDEKDAQRIWNARRSSMITCSKLKPDITTDDVIVPRENLPQLVKGIQNICTKYNLYVCMVGHVGDGSVHPQIPLDMSNPMEYKNYKQAKSEIYDLTIKLGGTLSGEHGIGLEKREYLPRVLSDISIEYMKQIKNVFDPKNILNPYKIF